MWENDAGMAEMFHVYVEGAVDPSPDALKKLAEIMASRYGLPIADVTARLAKGRFRVKANVDRATADVYVRDLGAVGAKVVIDAASKPSSPSIPAPSRTSTPASALPPRTSSPSIPAATTALPPRTSSPSIPAPTAALPPRTSSPSIPNPARTATPASGLRVATPAAGNKAVTSGLAAAFGGEATSGSQDLGVLGGDSGAFALSSVDGGGVEPELPEPSAFTPPPKSVAARAAKANHGMGTDVFAPPDAEEQEQKVDLASDEIEHRSRKVEEAAARRRASTPPATAPGVATPVLQRKVSTSIPPQNAPVTALPPRGRLGPLSVPRNRFAAGVVVAIVLGFLPMHVIASYREHDALQKIDSKFLADASAAADPASWAALDEPALKDKKSAQHGVMLTSLLLWALFAGGVGYIWFKRVPWDKLDAIS